MCATSQPHWNLRITSAGECCCLICIQHTTFDWNLANMRRRKYNRTEIHFQYFKIEEKISQAMQKRNQHPSPSYDLWKCFEQVNASFASICLLGLQSMSIFWTCAYMIFSSRFPIVISPFYLIIRIFTILWSSYYQWWDRSNVPYTVSPICSGAFMRNNTTIIIITIITIIVITIIRAWPSAAPSMEQPFYLRLCLCPPPRFVNIEIIGRWSLSSSWSL